MKIKPQVIFILLALVFFAVFVWQAREWRLQARLYPWAIGIPMLVLALIQLIVEIRGVRKKNPTGNAPVDYQFTQAMDTAVARRRTLTIFSWIFGFVISIWLLGFSLSVPLFVFLYLKVQSREPWALTLVLTAAAWVIFFGLFDRLLHLPFPDGKLLLWLGLT